MSQPITAQVQALYVYPVKSLAGIALGQATLTQAGLLHDRQWAVCDANGKVLTQRQHPRMALIQPQFEGEQLCLHHKQLGRIEVGAGSHHNASTAPVKVWKDHCPAVRVEGDVNAWLSEALQMDGLQLMHCHPSQRRKFNAPQRFDAHANYFSDAAPYLVANLSSLQALNRTLAQQGKTPVDIRQFRANIVIDGPPAFSEHTCHKLHSASHDFTLALVDHCQRCIMITVDPDAGEFSSDRSPFNELSQLNAMPDKAKAPAFGINARLVKGEQVTIRIGQAIVLEDDGQHSHK